MYSTCTRPPELRATSPATLSADSSIDEPTSGTRTVLAVGKSPLTPNSVAIGPGQELGSACRLKFLMAEPLALRPKFMATDEVQMEMWHGHMRVGAVVDR